MRSISRLLTVCLALIVPVGAFAATGPGNPYAAVAPSILNNTPLYGVCSGGTSTGTTFSGSISPNVGKGMTSSAQQKFQQILVAAGQKYNIDPNFVAAFYYLENARTGDSTNNADSASGVPVTGDGNWREPAPPYGTGAPWPPPNAATAQGPFQFINSTWAAYGVSANGNGSPDVNDLTDAAFGAANYLVASGAKLGATDADYMNAALSYNHSSIYAQGALNVLHYLEGSGSNPVSGSIGGTSTCASTPATTPGTYQNPFRDVTGLVPERIDEGVDFNGTGPVYAIGGATIEAVFTPKNPGIWWNKDGGNAVIYKLNDGPAAGKLVYVAEDCTPSVTQGETVTSDDTPSNVICNMDDGPDGIETGWALPGRPQTDEPIAGPDYYPKVPDGTAMAYGRNFSAFLQSIPTTPGGVLADSTNPSVVGGSLESGWPTSW
jgi:hypothetical protein